MWPSLISSLITLSNLTEAMDSFPLSFFPSLPYPLLIAISSLFLSILWYIKKNLSNSNPTIKGMLAPQLPGALPLIGHLHLLGAQGPLARTFSSWADKYGPIFTIRLGAYPTLVVSTQEAIKECFTTNDKTLAARPKFTHGIHLGYNYAGFVFASYGPYFVKLRKLFMLELLSPRKIESSKHAYESEINTLIKDSYNTSGVVDLSEWLERFALNILTKMIAGKRYFGYLRDVDDEGGHRVVKLIKDFMYVIGEFVPSDLIPFLGWFKYEGKVLKSVKEIAKDLDELVMSWMEEHDDDVRRRENGVSDEKQDFIDIMLSVIEDDDTLGHSRDNIIKSNVLNLILAGSDTMSIHMIWTLSLLLNNIHALKRAQKEIDIHVGRQRWVQTSDIKNLIYLEAIAKESLRLYPPGPLLVPHEATQDCTISGYLVPKGTRLFANVWKLQRDPSIWSHPESFDPERFINSSSSSNNNFEYLPFGFGRRACPGSALAMQVCLLTMARLLQGFEIHEANGDGGVDMKEGLGTTLRKANPLRVLLTPRLPQHCYDQMLEHS